MTISATTAGQRLRASQVNAIISALNDVTGLTTVTAVDATSRTTTSATFTGVLTAAGLCGAAFTAPPSGKVKIEWDVEIKNSASNASACSPAIRAGNIVGSGTVFQAATFDTAVRNDSANFIRVEGSTVITGLTAGGSYNVSLEQIATAGTTTVARRYVTVMPQIA